MSHKGIYLVGFCALLLSSSLYDFAFAVISFHLTGKAMTGAYVYALGYSSEIIVSIWLGGILDVYDKRRIFSYALFTKMFLFLAVSIWFSSTQVGILSIIVAAFLIDLINHTTNLTNIVTIATLYDGKERIQLEGMVLSISSVAKISGPILGGSLIHYLQKPNYLLMVAVGLQVIAVTCYSYMLHITKEKLNSLATEKDFKIALGGTIRMLKIIMHQADYRRLFLFNAGAILFIGVATLLMFPFFSYIHGIDDSQIGLLLSIGTSSSIILGLIISRYLNKEQLHRVTRYALLCIGISIIFLNFIDNFYLLATIFFLFEASCTLFLRTSGLYIQSLVPKKIIGSWWSAFDAVIRVFSLIGILVGGYLFDLLGGKLVYYSLGCLLIMISLIPMSKIKTFTKAV